MLILELAVNGDQQFASCRDDAVEVGRPVPWSSTSPGDRLGARGAVALPRPQNEDCSNPVAGAGTVATDSGMIRVSEHVRQLPFFRPVPLTTLPLLYHREHLFPYPSYGDTERTSTLRAYRMVTLENEHLRVEVAPELGGRVHSLFDKRIGQEILFSNPVVKPVRILPIWAFISGGIEFNFPIAHSPTSIATVGCRSGQVGNYAFIRVGEREARTGMEWVVELGLIEGSPVLVQRTAFRNLTQADHPWMSWTIAAVRSTAGTEFVHPPHRVLVHDDRLTETDWPGAGLNWDRHYQQMTALFWRPGSAPGFGAFHHDLGFGLLHLADPARLPGKKVWTYGHGRHRDWALATTEGDLAYAEIESGPLLDQSEKPRFPRGTELRYEEYWVPVHARDGFENPRLPVLDLPACPNPWLGWEHSSWQSEWERFRAGEGPLPGSTVPTGIELEAALRREVERGRSDAGEPLALWLAFRERPREALEVIRTRPEPTARRLAGLILWRGLGDPTGALPLLEAGPLNDPIAVCELDELLVELGQADQRSRLLGAASPHPRVIERRADLALTRGQPKVALRLLQSVRWPREHQRYVRTTMWKAAKAALGESVEDVPASLGEDNLAVYGAYWSSEPK